MVMVSIVDSTMLTEGKIKKWRKNTKSIKYEKDEKKLLLSIHYLLSTAVHKFYTQIKCKRFNKFLCGFYFIIKLWEQKR